MFRKLRQKTQGTLFVISHQERILNMADKIIYVKDGHIERYGIREQILPFILENAKDRSCTVLKSKKKGEI